MNLSEYKAFWLPKLQEKMTTPDKRAILDAVLIAVERKPKQAAEMLAEHFGLTPSKTKNLIGVFRSWSSNRVKPEHWGEDVAWRCGWVKQDLLENGIEAK